MSESETKEYIRDYTKDLYGLFKHGRRVTEHNRSNSAWANCKGCLDISHCQRLEWRDRVGCEAKQTKRV